MGELKKLFLVVLSAFYILPSRAQTTGQLTNFTDEPPQFLYLYEEIEALTGEKNFVDMITVDQKGNFTLPDFHPSGERVVVLESPPWVWRAIIDTEKSDVLLLHKPPRPLLIMNQMLLLVIDGEQLQEMF